MAYKRVLKGFLGCIVALGCMGSNEAEIGDCRPFYEVTFPDFRHTTSLAYYGMFLSEYVGMKDHFFFPMDEGMFKDYQDFEEYLVFYDLFIGQDRRLDEERLDSVMQELVLAGQSHQQ